VKDRSQYFKEYRESHKEQRREYQKKYMKGYWKTNERKQKHKETINRIHKQCKDAAYDLLGRVCVRCGFSDIRALQIDHVNNDGNIDRQKFGHRAGTIQTYKKVLKSQGEGFQVLCANCNLIKAHEYSQTLKGN